MKRYTQGCPKCVIFPREQSRLFTTKEDELQVGREGTFDVESKGNPWVGWGSREYVKYIKCALTGVCMCDEAGPHLGLSSDLLIIEDNDVTSRVPSRILSSGRSELSP